MVQLDCALCAGLLSGPAPVSDASSKSTQKLISSINLSWNSFPRPMKLKVCFTEYSSALKPIQDRIIFYAKQWTQPGVVEGIEFVQLEKYDQQADIRIRVYQTTGAPGENASYVGTNSLYDKWPEEYSMQLAVIGVKDEEDAAGVNMFRRRVLHEFGHALGFKHEAARTQFADPKEKVEPAANVTEKDKALISLKGLDAQIAQIKSEKVILYGKMEDMKSVMMYPRDTEPKIPWNTKLSDEDKKYANIAYPKLS